jgi:MoxR-like ATPase
MNTNATAPAASLPADVTALSWKETLELFKRLSPAGTVGFDYGKYRLADLRAVLAAWITQGVPAEVIAAHAAGIVAARNVAPATIPPAPTWANIATNAPAAPITQTHALPLPVAAPAPSVADSLAAAIAAQTAILQPMPAAIPLIAGNLPTSPARDIPAPQPDAFADAAIHAQPEPQQAPAAQPEPQQVTQPMPANHKLAREVFADLPPKVLEQIPATLTIPVYAHPDAEPIDYSYRFQASTLVPALIAMHQSPTVRIWCGGPRGTGKSEFIRAIAARTGRALYRVGLHRFTEASELIGDMGLSNGNTVWQDGPVAKALRAGDAGALLFDEITYGSAGALACLNLLLEQRGAPLRLPRTGESLPVPAGLFIAACDNTFGAGSESSEYVSRNEIGADTRDRFGYKMLFDYLPEADERDLLRESIQRATGRKPSAQAMRPIMNLLRTCRSKSDAGELQGAPSFRGAVAFATLLAFGQKPADAWTQAVVLGAPESSHEALRLVFSSIWPVDATGNLQTFQGEM